MPAPPASTHTCSCRDSSNPLRISTPRGICGCKAILLKMHPTLTAPGDVPPLHAHTACTHVAGIDRISDHYWRHLAAKVLCIAGGCSSPSIRARCISSQAQRTTHSIADTEDALAQQHCRVSAPAHAPHRIIRSRTMPSIPRYRGSPQPAKFHPHSQNPSVPAENAPATRIRRILRQCTILLDTRPTSTPVWDSMRIKRTGDRALEIYRREARAC